MLHLWCKLPPPPHTQHTSSVVGNLRCFGCFGAPSEIRPLGWLIRLWCQTLATHDRWGAPWAVWSTKGLWVILFYQVWPPSTHTRRPAAGAPAGAPGPAFNLMSLNKNFVMTYYSILWYRIAEVYSGFLHSNFKRSKNSIPTYLYLEDPIGINMSKLKCK